MKDSEKRIKALLPLNETFPEKKKNKTRIVWKPRKDLSLIDLD